MARGAIKARFIEPMLLQRKERLPVGPGRLRWSNHEGGSGRAGVGNVQSLSHLQAIGIANAVGGYDQRKLTLTAIELLGDFAQGVLSLYNIALHWVISA